MPVAQRLTTLHVCDKSIDIPYHCGLIRCESELRRQVEHGLFSFPVTRAIVARGEPLRRSPLVYSMRGFRTYPLLAHYIGRRQGKVEGVVTWRGRGHVKLCPLRRRSRGERGAVKLAPLRRRSRGGV